MRYRDVNAFNVYIYTKLVTEITGKRNNTKVKHFSRYFRSTT